MIRGIVTFDFDGTLTRILWREDLREWINSDQPNEKIVRLLRRLHARGFEIHVVTRRNSEWELPGRLPSCEHTTVGAFLRAQGLAPLVSRVHFVGDESWSGDKTAVLARLAPRRHYDDMQEHIDQARSAGIRARKIPRPDR